MIRVHGAAEGTHVRTERGRNGLGGRAGRLGADPRNDAEKQTGSEERACHG
jgi:hypothetical protein